MIKLKELKNESKQNPIKTKNDLLIPVSTGSFLFFIKLFTHNKIKGKKKQENLLKYTELARLSKRLATIDTEVPLDFNLEACRLTNFNNIKLNELFTNYGFKSFIAENHDNN